SPHAVRRRRRGPLRACASGWRDDFLGTGSTRLRSRPLVRPQLRRRGSRGTPLVVYRAAAESRALMPRVHIDHTLPALADRTRRRVVGVVRKRPQRAGDIGASLSVSPPLLSRHLRVLRKSGLIETSEVEHDARVRVYRLRPEPFAILRTWLEEVEKFWAA